MFDLKMDFDLEKLHQMYNRIGLFMPALVRDYNNRMAFNTRTIAKSTLRAGITVRPSFRYLTSGRVLSVKTARFSKNIENIESQVGGRIVSGARDPNFMARLEFGGAVSPGSRGETAIPTVKGARGGNKSKMVSKRFSAPRLAAMSVSAENIPGSPKQKRVAAMHIAIREKKPFVKMKDTKGRTGIYRVRGRGKGRNRKITSVTKMWILSKKSHSTPAIHWLSRAQAQAVTGRVKTFQRVAELHIARRALRGK